MEYEIDKLYMPGRHTISDRGLEKYKADCRAIFRTNAKDRGQTIECMVRHMWVDFHPEVIIMRCVNSIPQ